MKNTIELSPTEQQRLKQAMKRFREELKKAPEISDEAFMAEFEVSDEYYDIGLTLPGTGQGKPVLDEESQP